MSGLSPLLSDGLAQHYISTLGKSSSSICCSCLNVVFSPFHSTSPVIAFTTISLPGVPPYPTRVGNTHSSLFRSGSPGAPQPEILDVKKAFAINLASYLSIPSDASMCFTTQYEKLYCAGFGTGPCGGSFESQPTTDNSVIKNICFIVLLNSLIQPLFRSINCD